VVAEGIERPEHLELLREMGCGLGQGYLIARPMDARAIEVLIASGWPGDPEAPGRGDGGDPGRGEAAGPGRGEAAGPGRGEAAGPGRDREADPALPLEPALDPGEAPATAAPAAAPAKLREPPAQRREAADSAWGAIM